MSPKQARASVAARPVLNNLGWMVGMKAALLVDAPPHEHLTKTGQILIAAQLHRSHQ